MNISNKNTIFEKILLNNTESENIKSNKIKQVTNSCNSNCTKKDSKKIELGGNKNDFISPYSIDNIQNVFNNYEKADLNEKEIFENIIFNNNNILQISLYKK